MDIEKIKQLVSERNVEAERESVYTAQNLISKILSLRNLAKKIEQEITALQIQLKTLEAAEVKIEEVL